MSATPVEDAVLLERRTALPRVREVWRVEVVPDRDAAIAAVQKGLVDPAVVALVEEPVPGVPRGPEPRCLIEPRRRAAGVVVVDVRCKRTAFLVFAERFDPGWTATVDGAPARLYRTYGLVLGVRVGSGRHQIVLRYAAPRFAAGALASLLVAVVLAALVGIEAVRQRGSAPAPAA